MSIILFRNATALKHAHRVSVGIVGAEKGEQRETQPSRFCVHSTMNDLCPLIGWSFRPDTLHDVLWRSVIAGTLFTVRAGAGTEEAFVESRQQRLGQ